MPKGCLLDPILVCKEGKQTVKMEILKKYSMRGFCKGPQDS